jgi:hypothetical protein
VAIARQRRGEYVSAVMNQDTTEEELLAAVFSVWSVRGLHSEDQGGSRLRGACATLFLGDINTLTWPSRLEESRI